MRTLWRGLLVALALFTAGSSMAGPGGCAKSDFLTPFAFEQITISSTALPLTATTHSPSGAQPAALAVVIVETNSVRYRTDGLNPTATVGMPAAAGLPLTVCGPQSIRNVRFIRQSADATLSVEYYREGDN
jgi:hypothetical protein